MVDLARKVGGASWTDVATRLKVGREALELDQGFGDLCVIDAAKHGAHLVNIGVAEDQNATVCEVRLQLEGRGMAEGVRKSRPVGQKLEVGGASRQACRLGVGGASQG